MIEPLGRFLRFYSRVLNKHKYATQVATAGLLWFSGDILCQGLVSLAEDDRKPFELDWRRTGRMTLYGLGFSAPVYTFWYSFLERYSQRMFAQRPGTTAPWMHALLRRFPLDAARIRTWKIISFKLAMDTFVFDPLYLSLFFTITSVMEGRRLNEVGKKLREDLGKTWLVDIAVWTPIQTVNFRFVPVLYQALVVQSCNVGWNAYLSYVQHRNSR
ncbi:Peroxisomal membrane protein [Paramicrosporidium saccamoebae]|uniref:Peroxisomal membrane protein n=1 Tax=Paramicrosporidium saccamoebae TaxID=1246581 RepID=A0A2H9TFK1_9FUNG|nr:Peroxisomal membrane protein [Paramicrosporidium saccamoebae]